MKDRYAIRALTFEFHGIARRELEAAKAVAAEGAVVEHRFVRLPDLKEAEEIGAGKFAGYPATYIPMRNSVFYSLAASFAEEVRASTVVGGHNKDDLRLFRDVSPKFFSALEKTLRSGSEILAATKFRILRPLATRSKAQVVRLAAGAGVPLALTWSCHRNGNLHCWDCDGCLARIDSFEKAGVPDPLFPVRTGKIT